MKIYLSGKGITAVSNLTDTATVTLSDSLSQQSLLKVMVITYEDIWKISAETRVGVLNN